MKLSRIWVLGGALAIASASQAQMVMAARDSQLSFGWLYGYGPDIFTGGGSGTDGNLFTTGGIGLLGSESGSGSYIGHLWTAAVTWNLGHSYQITGSLGSASKIESSGLSTLTSAESGATCGIGASGPGNELKLDFTLAGSQLFHFFGSVQSLGPVNRNSSNIILYKHNGAGYQAYSVIGGVLQNTSFDFFATLPAGIYRMDAVAGSNASQTETAYAGWNYTMEAVPEPASVVALMSGLALLARRRRAA